MALAVAVILLNPAGAAQTGSDHAGVRQPNVDALAAAGVFAGTECEDGRFCPGEPIKRWTAAVWLVRVLDGDDPAPAGSTRFSDVDAESWWAPHVERLAELEITVGCRTRPLRYCPDSPVSRAQMATFLVRAFKLETAVAPAGFVDTARSVHAGHIDALADSGITVGCASEPARYCPDRPVTRAQMASFLNRARSMVRYTAVTAGPYHACGLRTEGTITCWGDNHSGQAEPPDGTFSAVSAGWAHTCGLRTDSTIACWGWNSRAQTNAPDGTFSAVSAGWAHTCGLRTDGTIACWGSDHNGQATGPDGKFAFVAAGGQHSCGLRPDGTAVCWGLDYNGQATPPEGRLEAITAGGDHTCGLRAGGTVECWGFNYDERAEPPEGSFSAVAAGVAHTCGLRADGAVECWGTVRDDLVDLPDWRFEAVAAGQSYSCGLRTDGRLFCWGDEHREIVEPASRELVSIAVGAGACGLEADGTLVCWLNNYDERDGAPDGQISAGITDGLHHCTLRSANSFGRREYGHGYPHPRHITCFGIHYDRDPGQPREPVVAVAVGGSHACAVLADESISCWGSGGQEADAPDGRFSAVAAGGWHSCGLRTDNTIECWGNDFYGQADPSDGHFTAVATGGHHSCGLRADGMVDCWGLNDTGQADPPAGRFTAIAVGGWHSCGLHADGALEGGALWGLAWQPSPRWQWPRSQPALTTRPTAPTTQAFTNRTWTLSPPTKSSQAPSVRMGGSAPQSPSSDGSWRYGWCGCSTGEIPPRRTPPGSRMWMPSRGGLPMSSGSQIWGSRRAAPLSPFATVPTHPSAEPRWPASWQGPTI